MMTLFYVVTANSVNLTKPLEHVAADEAIERNDIEAVLELEADFSETGKKQVKLAIVIKCACRLDGKRLNFAVRKRRIVDLLASKTLDVYRNDALVGEHHTVADRNELRENLLALDEHLRDHPLAFAVICL